MVEQASSSGFTVGPLWWEMDIFSEKTFERNSSSRARNLGEKDLQNRDRKKRTQIPSLITNSNDDKIGH